jgi:TPR repeat protein
MSVKYCNAACQKNHWPTHKKDCKLRAAELRDEALFKDPPAKEDCPICFLPMPIRLLSCMTLPPATIYSIPIYDYAIAHEELANKNMEGYYSCCGKSICRGCEHSFNNSGNTRKCPYCNSDRGKTEEEDVKELMKRAEANDPASIYLLACYYHMGLNGIQQDHTKAMELYAKAADLGCSMAHNNLGVIYYNEGKYKKSKFHSEAAAMAGDDVARTNIGIMEANSGNMDRAVEHWKIAALAGYYHAMHHLIILFEKGAVCRELIALL